MFGRHIFLYFLAMGIPSIINFFSIIVYTRMLIPEEYGKYALIIVVVRMFGNILFQWLRLALYRFFPSHEGDNRKYLLSTAFFIFTCMSILTIGLYVTGIFFLFPNGISMKIWLLGLLLILSQEWFETNLGILRHKLLPKKFGILSFTRAILSLATGVLLLFSNWGPTGILMGILVGTIIPSFFITFQEWKGIHPRYIKWDLIKELLVYGMPLSGTFALGFIIYGTDRLFIQYYSGVADVGLYAVSYDLVNQSIFVLLNVINAASYPIILRKYESGGEEIVQSHMKQTIISLLFIGVGAVLGITLLASNISFVLLGVDYRETAALLIPFIAPAVLLNALKQYYVDIPFKLKKKSYKQLLPVVIGGIVNVILNMWWIPHWGVYGAAYASLTAYIITFIVSISLANRLMKFPFPIKEMFKIGLASIAMSAFLFPFISMKGILGLFMQVSIGLGVYMVAAVFLNIGGMKVKSKELFNRLLKKEKVSDLSKSS